MDGHIKIPDYEYNHREILFNEVVLDFDDKDFDTNLVNAKEVMLKMDADQVTYYAYKTGGKGIHLHTFWNGMDKVKDISLMKRTIMKYYAWGMNIDYQLSGKHLVRMEYGVYEKTRKNIKEPLFEFHEDIPRRGNVITKALWTNYINSIMSSINRRLDLDINPEVEGIVKDIITGKIVLVDGRKNMLWFLIHQLKGKMEQDEVISKLISWYNYNGGTELSDEDIRRQVVYQWSRTYSFSKSWIDRLLKNSKRIENE
jgi:hypothetical protein